MEAKSNMARAIKTKTSQIEKEASDVKQVFYLDSVSTDHIVRSAKLLHDFKSFDETKEIFVKSSSGHQMAAIGRGNLYCLGLNGNPLVFLDVLVVLNSDANIYP